MGSPERVPELISLNVGGVKFTTSKDTLLRKDPSSMFAHMFNKQWEGMHRRDEKGRIFIDRDPSHFALILNYLRDGVCVIPSDPQTRQELFLEADFYQLEGLKALLICEERSRPYTAAQLRTCIAERLQDDEQLKATVDVLLSCAFGRNPFDRDAKLPTRAATVEVRVRENAINALSPQPKFQLQDETLYVAFQQSIRIQGTAAVECYEAKHESQLIYEEACLSYDPSVYGTDYASRFHIKTLEVYKQHCIAGLSAEAGALRSAALYVAENSDAVLWALELCGFKDVALKVHEKQTKVASAERVEATCGGAGAETVRELFCTHQPLLCAVRCSLYLAL